MEKVVIFDSGIPQGGKNKIFDRQFAYAISHTLLPLWYLYEEAKKEGITFITPDVFLEKPDVWKNKEILLISHLVHPHTERMIALGAKPFLLTCQESPFISTRFYVGLKKYSDMFRYSMLFLGMEKRVSGKTSFLPMFFPQFFSKEKFVPMPFKDKKFITYIASNKETNSFLKRSAIKLLYGFSVQLIYPLRRKIIRFLSDRNSLDLYGRGWEKETIPYITKVYRGPVDDKEAKLREYKFVLCLENAVFPGYVTEKIFDCFFAGSVPVYMGAPDIDSYLPRNTFINIKDFKNLEDLGYFMDSIDEATYNVYLKNIQDFLHSPAYDKFSHERFAQTILTLIRSV
jgi:hypothetical protein